MDERMNDRLMQDNEQKRFTVSIAKISRGDGLRTVYLVLDNGIPAVAVNRAIMPKKDYQRPPNQDAYRICVYLNWLDTKNKEYLAATMSDIYMFLAEHYSAFWSKNTLDKYIDVIGKLYETFSILGYTIDESLYRPYTKFPGSAKSIREASMTKIWMLKQLFAQKKNVAWMKYTKWYTPEQIKAISEQLPLVYRIVFLLTVYLGYRCSTAISIKMSSLDLKNRRVTPTYSKTKRVHTSPLTDELTELIRSYIINVRAKNKGNTSEYLLLNQHGNPVTYHGYNAALKRAAEKVRTTYPDLELGEVHTHAGRSTFAANLRSYQLRQQREGKTTFTDSDFCALMDWKNLDCLTSYDKATRIQDCYDMFAQFSEKYLQNLEDNMEIYKE